VKIPKLIQNTFEKESEGVEWGEVSIKARFKGGEPVFFVDKQLSFLIKDNLPTEERAVLQKTNRGNHGEI
jgi:hypothetical protein